MPQFIFNCPLDVRSSVSILITAGPEANLKLTGARLAFPIRQFVPPRWDVRELWAKEEMIVLKSGEFREVPLGPGSAMRDASFSFSFEPFAVPPHADPNYKFGLGFVDVKFGGPNRRIATLATFKWHLEGWSTCTLEFTADGAHFDIEHFDFTTVSDAHYECLKRIDVAAWRAATSKLRADIERRLQALGVGASIVLRGGAAP